jgi:hypothetical protein
MAPNKDQIFTLLLLLILVTSPGTLKAASVPHKLAVGTTYIGGQLHWGFAQKWALEFRGLKSKQTTDQETVTAYAYGARGYRYFRSPSRVRFFMGLEGAATRSSSSSNDYKTTGFALGGFAGTELYLLKRLSIGVDVGPYMLTSQVRQSETTDGDVAIVINTFMNFYFL